MEKHWYPGRPYSIEEWSAYHNLLEQIKSRNSLPIERQLGRAEWAEAAYHGLIDDGGLDKDTALEMLELAELDAVTPWDISTLDM